MNLKLTMNTMLAVTLAVGSMTSGTSFAANGADETSFQDQATTADDGVQADGIDRFRGRPGPGPGRPIFRPRPRRTFDPVRFRGGGYRWARWSFPFFVRPVYYWDYARLRSVTCTAVDSVGSTYPVTEYGYVGIAYRARLNEIQDASMNRCYAESGGDTSCRFAGCTAGY